MIECDTIDDIVLKICVYSRLNVISYMTSPARDKLVITLVVLATLCWKPVIKLQKFD